MIDPHSEWPIAADGSTAPQDTVHRCAPKPAIPATHASRSCARQLFREFPNHDVKITSRKPRTPNTSWIGQRYLLLGINHAHLPRGLDLQTPRAGRAIKYSPRMKTASGAFETVSMAIAMFPVSPSISFIPPYPGVPYEDSDTPNSSGSCYIDGTQGAFDARHYPQLFDIRAQWRGFHDNPGSLEWNPETCENLSPMHFFRWNQPDCPPRGGDWIIKRLGAAFSRRELMESNFAHLKKQAAEQPHMRWFNDVETFRASFDLPWYDPLEWKDVLEWRTWGEGRDQLAYTLQYIAALKALNRWLAAMIQPVSRRGAAVIPPPNPALMGVWASSITLLEHWDMLLSNSVPIYIATVIPNSHPMHAKIVPGNLDGDERYRVNAFDGEHGFEPYWLSRHANEYAPVHDLNLECRGEYIPSSLFTGTSPDLPINGNSASYLFTWHSPIYLDAAAWRVTGVTLEYLQRQKEVRRGLDEDYPVMSNRYRILKADTDRHPLLDIIGTSAARDNKATRYEEQYDAELDAYYPKRLGRRTPATKHLLDTAIYRWIYPNENLEIVSEFSFPGREPSFGRSVEEDDEAGIEEPVDTRPRRYYQVNSVTNQPTVLAFTWQPFVETRVDARLPITSLVKTATPQSNSQMRTSLWLPSPSKHQLFVYDDPVSEMALERRHLNGTVADDSTQAAPGPALFTDYAKELVALEEQQEHLPELISWRCRYVVWQGVLSGDEDPMDDLDVDKTTYELERYIGCLEKQRERLRDQIQRRLFKPAKGDSMVSGRVIPWKITGGGSQDICYPLRIGGLHGDASQEVIFAMLNEVLQIRPHDVVMFSSYREVDTTLTIELGLRCCEDALHLRTLLHGIEVDDRLLEVQFLHGMSKLVHAIAYHDDPKQQRSIATRLLRTVALNAHVVLFDQVVKDAYQLERDLAHQAEETGELSPYEIHHIKQKERRPLQNPLYSLQSLLTMEGREEFCLPFTITQSISLGEPTIVAPSSDRLFCYLSMKRTMRWQQSVKQPGRPTGSRTIAASQNNIKHKAIPKEHLASSMSSQQRQSLKRAIAHHADYLQHCWKPVGLHLPAFTPAMPTETGEKAVVKLYEQLWDWQDQCRDAMRNFRDQGTSAQYDFSSFNIAFGEIARCDALRGPYYSACVAALQRRTNRPETAGPDSNSAETAVANPA